MQPAFPVQAIRPARTCEALTASPIASMALTARSTLASLTPEIRRFCQTVSRISPSPRSAAILASPRICSQVTLPSGSATPIQFNPACFCWCTPIWAIRSKAGRGASASAGTRVKVVAELCFDELEEFLHSDFVDDIFQAGLETVGPVAGIDEDPHDRVGDFGGVRRLDDDAGFLGEILVPGDAADAETKPHAGLDAEAILHLNSGEGDVVGVFQHRDLARAVERDVELARQAVKRAVVENMKMPFARIFAGVDQFLRIDTRRRRARDVADVVGAGTARAQAEILNALDQRDRVLRRNFTDLKIGAGRDMAKRTAQPLGEIGKSGELPVLENAVGNAQPAHVGVLRRARRKTGRNSASENCPPAMAARWSAPVASAADRHRRDALRA